MLLDWLLVAALFVPTLDEGGRREGESFTWLFLEDDIGRQGLLALGKSNLPFHDRGREVHR